jgi:hypothetical protein
VIEVFGYVFMIVGFWLGVVSLPAFLAFTLLAIVLGILVSVSALMLEEMSFHLYPRPRQLALLFLMSVVENFGYRQITLLWRLSGLLHWLFGTKAKWGAMPRSATWHQPKS